MIIPTTTTRLPHLPRLIVVYRDLVVYDGKSKLSQDQSFLSDTPDQLLLQPPNH